MASGKIEKSFHTGFKVIAEWSSTATASSNSSVVSVTMKLYAPYAIQISGRAGNKVVINGVTYTYDSSAINTSGGTTHTLGTVKSNAITHNDDGTKSVSISASFNVNATLSGTYYGTQTATGTAALDTISRASTLTCSGGYVGDTVSIVINKASSNYTHTVFWNYGDGSGNIATKTTASRLTWTIDEYIGTAMGAASAVYVTLGCYTYNGNTKVGETSIRIIVQKNTTAKPKVSYSIIDTNSTTTALTGDNSVLIKYVSNAKVSVTATGQNGATISSIVVRNSGQAKSGAITTFNGVQNNGFTITVKDSYNNQAVYAAQPQMLDYVKLTCYIDDESITAAGKATLTIKGNYFNDSFGSKRNTLTVKYRYKESSGSYSSWYTATVSKSRNTYSATGTITGLDYKASYTFEAQATDRLMTVNSGDIAASALTVFDWSKDDFNFNVPVTITDASLTCNGFTLNDEDGYERVVCDASGNVTIGDAENYSNTTIHGRTVDIDCYNFTVNGEPIGGNDIELDYGIWTPKCNVISSYTQRYGTYMRVGDAVTISFCIAGTASKSDDTIEITGIPFSPHASHKWQAGGGNFANGLTTANNVFSGWTIENGDSVIYARSTATSTSKSDRSSGYIGATSGQTLYMAGTIMYRAA